MTVTPGRPRRPARPLALPPPPPGMSRRGFLAVVVAGAAAAAVGCSSDDEAATPPDSTPSTPGTGPGGTSGEGLPVPELAADPFTLGVASGDPLDTSVILWTRLAVEPHAADGSGGMPAEAVPVRFEVAADETFAQLVAEGTTVATPELGHSVHVEASGLQPASPYWYRFSVGDWTSAVGRTRTLPAPGDEVDRFAFAFASCQNYQDGFWTAYPHLAAEDLDLVVFLGDYIYEGGPSEDGVRRHEGPEVMDLAAYRNRYATYKADAGLQAVHAAFPWVVTWDDHEVENNYADDVPQDPADADGFLARRAVAYHAYYEHLPLRIEPPEGPDATLHRSFRVGSLAELFVIDTRQHRDDQVCDDGSGLPAAPRCDDALDPARTILGDEQRAWLVDGLEGSTARWNVLANQVVFTDLPIAGSLYNMDQWDGYVADRDAVLAAMAASAAPTIIVTGDIHLAGAADLLTDWADPAAEVLGVELVGTSIGSQFPAEFIPVVEATSGTIPYVRYVNAAERGYCMVELTPDIATATFRVVDTVTEPESPVRTDATFTVAHDDPRLTTA